MKKISFIIILLMLLTLTGCSKSQKLTCTATDETTEIKKYSTLDIKIKNNRVKDMKFTVDTIFPESYQNQLQTMANNIKSSKPYMDVILIKDGIRLITNDDPDNSFIGIKMDQEITYNELKEVLELQDYICK